MASWIKKYSPDLLCKRMEEAKSLTDDGRVTFKGLAHSNNVVVLGSMVALDDEIPEVEKRRIIHRAPFNAGSKGTLTARSILSEIKKLERAYLASPQENFRLITDISLSSWEKYSAVRFCGSCITVNPVLNKLVVGARDKLLEDAKEAIFADLPRGYAKVSVSVTARSKGEAVEKALDRLDFIRGLEFISESHTHLQVFLR